MKKFLKIIGLLLFVGVYYFANNESLPKGTKVKEAEELAQKMMNAINKKAFDTTEIIEWNFRGEHQYKWKKQEGLVEVSWDDNQVVLNLNDTSKSTGENQKIIQTALDYFNNDSFWLVAPYKVFDDGVERSVVKVDDKDALMVTYTSGGSTPGDSYLWILDSTFVPTSYKMWTSIIPLGGVSASWNNMTTADSGIKLPTKHTLSLFGMELNMGDVKASSPKADMLANKILKKLKHEAYKNTRYIEWSFRGKRFFKWDKQKHIIEVKWDNNTVILHPNDLEKSNLFIDGKESTEDKEKLVKRAEAIFNNDSFWLVGPHKLFEPGILRTLVQIEGKDALKVKYTTGGSTPSDSYIWVLNDDFLPVKFLMTVPSMKMDQVPATWEDWIETESGTLLPKNHTFSSGSKLSMGDVKAYN